LTRYDFEPPPLTFQQRTKFKLIGIEEKSGSWQQGDKGATKWKHKGATNTTVAVAAVWALIDNRVQEGSSFL